MHTFGPLLVGDVANDTGGYWYDGFYSSVITNTVLMERATELSYLQSLLAGGFANILGDSLQACFDDSDNTNLFSLVYHGWKNGTTLLQDVLRELFENITLSMMSSETLRMSDTTAPKANVTQIRYHIVFSYEADKLFIAYGVAFLLALVNVTLGFLAIALNHGSFSSRFSTVLEATRHAELSCEIESADQLGREPLPRYLATATLKLREIPEEIRKAVAGRRSLNTQ